MTRRGACILVYIIGAAILAGCALHYATRAPAPDGWCAHDWQELAAQHCP